MINLKQNWKKEQDETLEFLKCNWNKLTNSEKAIVGYLEGVQYE